MDAGRRVQRSPLAPALLAALFSVLTTAIYIREISAQSVSDLDSSRVQFIIGYLVVLALAGGAAALRPRLNTVRASLLCAVTAGLAVLGFLAMFSVGAGLMIGAAFAAAALVRVLENLRPVPAVLLCLLGSVVALGILFGGLFLTS